MNSNKTTTKAKLLLQSNTHEELSKTLGMCRKTLYDRLKKNNWKVLEIEKLKNYGSK